MIPVNATNTSMINYYARRALEYERVYERPERQTDLRNLEQVTAEAFPGLRVLEVACGTGYWTQFAARSAASILRFHRGIFLRSVLTLLPLLTLRLDFRF